jgi:hypothetical protein
MICSRVFEVTAMVAVPRAYILMLNMHQRRPKRSQTQPPINTPAVEGEEELVSGALL